MVFGVCTIRDKVAEQCGPLFQSVNLGTARRNFVRLLEEIPAYDRDAFELWKLGNFDDSTGKLELFEVPEIIEVNIPKFEEIGHKSLGFEGVRNG